MISSVVFLFTALVTTVVNAGSYRLLSFPNATVVRWHMDHNLLAVALNNKLIITYRTKRVEIVDNEDVERRYTLELTELRRDANPVDALLHFSISRDGYLLACSNDTCYACKATDANAPWDKYGDSNISSTGIASSFSATIADGERLASWLVTEQNSAQIKLYDKHAKSLIGSAKEFRTTSKINVLYAFNTHKYAYFVGSASREDLVQSMRDNSSSDRTYREGVRITRICNHDATRSLESRINLALTCEGLSNAKYYKASPNRAKFARVVEAPGLGTQLVVVVENGTSGGVNPYPLHETNNVVCTFDMVEISRAMDDIWDSCQMISKPFLQEQKCRRRTWSEMPDECYLFSWKMREHNSMSAACGATSHPIADSCSVPPNLITENTWIESFKPFAGSTIGVLRKDVRQFHGIALETWHDRNRQNGEYADNKDSATTSGVLIISHSNIIERVTGDEDSRLLWSTSVDTDADVHTRVDVDVVSHTLLYNNQDKIIALPLTCYSLYSTCSALRGWADPLKCGWCVSYDEAIGRSYSRLHDFCETQSFYGACPPLVHKISFLGDNRYVLFGEGFGDVMDLKITACQKDCPILRQLNTIVHYESLLPNCPIMISGRLKDADGDNDTFIFHYKKHLTPSKNGGSIVDGHVMVVALCVSVALVLIIGATIFSYRRIRTNAYRRNIREILAARRKNTRTEIVVAKRSRAATECISSITMGSAPVEAYRSDNNSNHYCFSEVSASNTTTNNNNSNNDGKSPPPPYIALSPDGPGALRDEASAVPSKQLVPEEEDEEKNKELDRNMIEMKRRIGYGFSSRVHLATFVYGWRCATGEPLTRLVAVKTINNQSVDPLSVRREIQLIAACSHKNIVEYLGYFHNADGMNIVTEYMAGGDLHNYLIDPANAPTFGDAFLFILQICEGMEYLIKNHIIHRDLAARNCMMNEDKVIVKITDFGLCRRSNTEYEYVSENARQQLPFRWTAIECFDSNKFSEKSDIWSFGVVIWEIFSRTAQPYNGMNITEVADYLRTGKRLANLPWCSDEIYQKMMTCCWEAEPRARPSFTRLRIEIERIYWKLQMKVPQQLASEYLSPKQMATSLKNGVILYNHSSADSAGTTTVASLDGE